MPTKSRREKIAAIAKTSEYNPEEAAVAQAMLERLPETQLDTIADQIKAEWGKGIESQFEVGRLLAEAADMFPPQVRYVSSGSKVGKGSPYGDWFRAQNFPFTPKTAQLLRTAFSREAEVRALIESRTKSTTSAKDIGVVTAIGFLLAGPQPVADVGPTTPVDPAYAALRDAAHRILGTEDEPKNAFLTMHVDDLVTSAGWIKGLVTAYQEARDARSG